MLRVRPFGAAVIVSLALTSAVFAQGSPKPGPEHQKLKELEGTWDVVMKFGDSETKGKVVYKMDLGGLWLLSEFDGEFAPGEKFFGRGLDSYDAHKKKYVSVLVDSMAASPTVSSGNYDKEGKVLTMTGEGPGEDGKPTKYKMTTEHKDKDQMLFSMFSVGADGKETPLFTIAYKRRK